MQIKKKESLFFGGLLMLVAAPVVLMALQVYRYYYTNVGFDYKLDHLIDILTIIGMFSAGLIVGLLVPRVIKERRTSER